MAAVRTKLLSPQDQLEKFFGAENNNPHWLPPPSSNCLKVLIRFRRLTYLQNRGKREKEKEGEFAFRDKSRQIWISQRSDFAQIFLFDNWMDSE